MVYRSFGIVLFGFGFDTDGEFDLDVLYITMVDWEGSLFHLERRGRGSWNLDLFWLRDLYLRMTGK